MDNPQSTEEKTPFRLQPIHWLVLFGTTGSLLVIDQLTKTWVDTSFALYERRVPIEFLEPVFDLTYTRNTGAAFGLFDSASNLFLVVALIASMVIIYYYRQIRENAWIIRVAMGMQMAGALGNAIDRIMRGYVVDFLHVHYDPVGFDYPIFNVADMSIVIGVIVLILFLGQLDDTIESSEETNESVVSDSV